MTLLTVASMTVRSQVRAMLPASLGDHRGLALVPLGAATLVGVSAAFISHLAIGPAGNRDLVVTTTEVGAGRLVVVAASFAALLTLAFSEITNRHRSLHNTIQIWSTGHLAPIVGLGAQLAYGFALVLLLVGPLVVAAFAELWAIGLAASVVVTLILTSAAILLAVVATVASAVTPRLSVALPRSSSMLALIGVSAALGVALRRFDVALDGITGWRGAWVFAILGPAAVGGVALIAALTLGSVRRHPSQRSTTRTSWLGRHRAALVWLEAVHRTLLRAPESRSIVLQCACLNFVSGAAFALTDTALLVDAAPLVVVLNAAVWAHLAISHWGRYNRFPYFERFGSSDARPAALVAISTLLPAALPFAGFLAAMNFQLRDPEGVLVGVSVLLLSIALAVGLGAFPTMRRRLVEAETLYTAGLFLAVFIGVRLIGLLVLQSAPIMLALCGLTLIAVILVGDDLWRRQTRAARRSRSPHSFDSHQARERSVL